MSWVGAFFRRFTGGWRKEDEITEIKKIQLPETQDEEEEEGEQPRFSPKKQIISPKNTPGSKQSRAFHYRLVTKRNSITPELFRSGINSEISNLSLSSVFGTPKHDVSQVEDDSGESYVVPNFEKSPMQIGGVRTTPVSISVREGETEKRAAMMELSKLMKTGLISTNFRDKLFADFAGKLDQFNKKRQKEKNKPKEAELDDMSLAKLDHCQNIIDLMVNDAEKWKNVDVPAYIIHDDVVMNDVKVGEKIINLPIDVTETLICLLDELSTGIQTVSVNLSKINKLADELSSLLSDIARGPGDPLAIVASTKP